MMDDLNDICGRCLVVVNGSTRICARGPETIEECPVTLNPFALKHWARNMLYVNRWVIEVNERTHLFLPVATYHGDPVCSTHLWQLVEAERKGLRW
jgi:hypothetical protein